MIREANLYTVQVLSIASKRQSLGNRHLISARAVTSGNPPLHWLARPHRCTSTGYMTGTQTTDSWLILALFNTSLTKGSESQLCFGETTGRMCHSWLEESIQKDE